MPDEVVDVYSDQFQININAWGATLNFQLSSHQPPAPGGQAQADRVATVRTSLQHLKVLAFMLTRQVKTFEDESQVDVQVPVRILSALAIAPEDWDPFWRRTS